MQIQKTASILLFALLVILALLVFGCASPSMNSTDEEVEVVEESEGSKEEEIASGETSKFPQWDTLLWKDMASLIPDARLDIRYATDINFTEKVIYDCPACLLRKEAAKGLVAAADDLRTQGYGLILFDCYRPAPYQQRLWDVVPDPRYVAPPEKGSNHSRGMAIDLSLYFIPTGEELDMGTEYDFFGREAHPGYPKLAPIPSANREILNRAMENAGFEPITSEWWHFDFKGKRYEVSDFLWPCDLN